MTRPWMALGSGWLTLCVLVNTSGEAAERIAPELARSWDEQVRPFLNRYCVSCHGNQRQEAKLNLAAATTIAQVLGHFETWESMGKRVQSREMPPAEADVQPTADERQRFAAWLSAVARDQAERWAGDPGIVLARRLSQRELDYSLRDLTGVDLHVTRDFPIDPANEAGFDNTGDSLTVSPAWIKKYLAATRLVAEHLLLQPNGFVFAPHPVVTDPDRDKYCVTRIVEFYRRHEVDYARYLAATWRYRFRAEQGRPDLALDDLARETGLSPRYLKTVWEILASPLDEPGVLGELRTTWRSFPSNLSDRELTARCEELRNEIHRWRQKLDDPVERLQVKGISNGSQPFVLWWNREVAARRQRCSRSGKEPFLADADERFCRVFPNAFAIVSRGAYFDAKLGAEARLLTAGFHLMQGYFRDDGPLVDLVLNDQERHELDRLWGELWFVTRVPQRQYKDFVFFERAEPPRFAGGPEFDFARSEDDDVTSPTKLARMKSTYLKRAAEVGATKVPLEAIESYFDDLGEQIRKVETARLAAEQSHRQSLERFAERAWRRPIAAEQRTELQAAYREKRNAANLDHEEALRECIVEILMSPRFLFRLDGAGDAGEVRDLDSYELASRLSFFLWSSLPDQELLDRAAAGDLARPDVLVGQARRMLRDQRLQGMATEFLGNWLNFRQFSQHNSVDRRRFPEFTDELRAAMFAEPVQYFLELARSNRSLVELIAGRDTVVNEVLARHYGIPWTPGNPGEWRRIIDADRWGRGGVLPMAVFLTQNSPGLRTSPVQRGYWVVRRLLGEQIPAPPPNVPELPADESQLGSLSLREVLARHREHQACAGCHQRFDGLGLAFEGYGPVGERRERDLGGRPIDVQVTFPPGRGGMSQEWRGVDGLREYVLKERREDFCRQFCSKLLSFALSRRVQPSDSRLLDEMRRRGEQEGYRLEVMVECLVTSPQFLRKRVHEVAAIER